MLPESCSRDKGWLWDGYRMDIGSSKDGRRIPEGSSKDESRANPIDQAQEEQGIILKPDSSETANPEIIQGFEGWPPTGVLRECRLG